MDISEKQAVWREQKPLFEAEFIHSHLLPFFNFNENTGDYEIKSECVNNTDDEDRKVAYEALNTGWVMWLRAKRDAKAQAVPEGYILIPKKMPDEVNDHLWDFMTDNFVCTNDYGDSFMACDDFNLDKFYAELVKAQEPAND